MLYKDFEKRRALLRTFIKNNSQTTHKEIKKELHSRVERVYTGGMAEAFLDAGVNPPRTFKMKNKDERKRILLEYIRKNPGVGGQTIAKNTKINIGSVFSSIKEAYEAVGVPYLRENQRRLQNRSQQERRQAVINLVRENPLITIEEIVKRCKVHFYRIFNSMEEVYQIVGISLPIKKRKKYHTRESIRKLKKRQEIIDFIKKNPLATQREINSACKTHVQLNFNKGIFEAYELAGLEFPYERINLHGAAIKEIRHRADEFEEEIANKLTGYGAVNRLVKIKRGFADIIFERKGEKAIIEVKDYLAHEISISQVKQLNRYLQDSNCNMGFLICKKKPKKDRFLIDRNTIFILTADELAKIPEVMDKGL